MMPFKGDESTLSAILEGALDGIIVFDDQAVIQIFNAAAERIFNYAANEVVGEQISVLSPVSSLDDDKQDIVSLWRLTADGAGGRSLVVGRRKDGTEVSLDVTIGETLIDDSRMYSVILREHELMSGFDAAFDRGETVFQQMAENVSDVVWMTDPGKGQMIYISPSYETIWGRTCVELLENPMSFVDAIDERDRDRVLTAFPEQPKGTYAITFRIVRPDGEIRWIEDRAFPIRDDKGEVYRVVGLAQDVTERKKLEEELSEAAKSLDEKNKTLEGLSSKLSKYLSPQIYASVFSGEQKVALETKRKKLTIFFPILRTSPPLPMIWNQKILLF